MEHPFLLRQDPRNSTIAELLGKHEFSTYVAERILAAGVNLLAERHRKRPWFGYPDTKFNPNSGVDLGLAAYERQYCWFLGRGAEAMHRHLYAVDELEPYVDDAPRVRALLTEFIHNQIDAILRVHALNAGRFPMTVDRDGHAINGSGERIEVDPNLRSPGDAFCAKALICTGRTGTEVTLGVDLLHEFTTAVLEDRFHMDQLNDDPDMISQGSAMLTLAAVPYLAARGFAEEWVSPVVSLLEQVFSRHYHKDSGRFVEYVSRETGAAYPILNPGHCTEFACLALLAVHALRTSAPEACETPAAKPMLELTVRTAPALIQRSFELGYNNRHGGVYVTVDPDTGEPINNTMPWWSLPEFFRAGVAALVIPRKLSATERNGMDSPDELMNIVVTAHNAYVTHYLNSRLHLFPFQTRHGESGEVIPITPAVPEGDPLYHTNLAYMDALWLTSEKTTWQPQCGACSSNGP